MAPIFSSSPEMTARDMPDEVRRDERIPVVLAPIDGAQSVTTVSSWAIGAVGRPKAAGPRFPDRGDRSGSGTLGARPRIYLNFSAPASAASRTAYGKGEGGIPTGGAGARG